MLDQAVFTSDESAPGAGYHVVGRSAGVTGEEAQELVNWCPSHDALQSDELGAESVSFYRLASGRYVITHTTAAGGEASERGGSRVYSQCLLATPEFLQRFGNNPFAVLRAALASGKLEVHEHVPGELEAFDLPGGAAAVNQALLARLAIDPGTGAMAALIEAALAHENLGLLGVSDPRKALDGLLNCLPVECRPALSFATALRHSPRRPFRLLGLGHDVAEARRLQKQQLLTLIDFGAEGLKQAGAASGWARLIRQVFQSGKVAFFATQLSAPRPGLTLDQLESLAADLQVQLSREVDQQREAEVVRRSGSFHLPPAETKPEAPPSDVVRRAPSTASRILTGHASHAPAAEGGVAVADSLELGAPENSQLLDQLQQLDDLVFEVIAGRSKKLRELERLWSAAQRQLPAELCEESREHYVRSALKAWEDCVAGEEIRNPARAIAAVEIVRLLLA